MHINARGWVSVVELVVFLPALIASIITCSRHGFRRSSGWIYTLILCVVRIAGAVCQLLTYHDNSSGLLKATIIIDSIGLSPLLLATLGMLSRLVDWINAHSQSCLGLKQFRLIQLVITLGLILSVAGGSSGSSSNGQIKISTTSKVGVILFIVGYVACIAVWLLAMGNIRTVPSKERRTAAAVLFALPFIGVRLTYSTLAVFLHDHHFNVINGSVVVLVCMAVLEEFIVVFAYIVLGWTLDKLQPEEIGVIANRAWKQRGNGRRNGQGPPVHTQEPSYPRSNV